MGFIQGLVDEWALPALHTAEGLTHMGAFGHAAEGALESGGKIVPLLGAAIGLIDAGVNIYQAVNHTGDERWDHIGGAVLGALGAIPAVGAYTGGAELAWNGGTALASKATGHGWGGGEEEGMNANQWIGRIGRRLFGDGADITHQRMSDEPGPHYSFGPEPQVSTPVVQRPPIPTVNVNDLPPATKDGKPIPTVNVNDLPRAK
jgi:hypothetical protein